MRPSLLWFAVDNYCRDAVAVDVAVADALEMRDAESGRVHDDAVDVAVPMAPAPPMPDGVADGDDDAMLVAAAVVVAVAAAGVAAAAAEDDGAGDIDVCVVA